ncbi:MAG: TonB-dependent receptor [Betaproteobacteria bacterium]|nr:TonB-dependent receptor [Betaproteobacteria bacterium]
MNRSKFPLASKALLNAAVIAALPSAWAGGEHHIERVVIVASGVESEETDAASAGTVTRAQIQARTAYRPGELLEATPGMIVSQHSGEGKANQLYLRGFNLDHGTDFRTTVDGMLVNQRSHAHGQGWTDLNFVIPELVAGLEYRKGPYHAADGDFSSAGSAHLRYANTLPRSVAEVSAGSFGFARMLLADSPAWNNGNLLYAIEALHKDGPFTHPDNYRKINAVLRYSEGDTANGFHAAAMFYRGRWNSTDQIPRRALAEGVLKSRFDAIDTSDGGAAHRASLSAAWQRSDGETATRLNAWITGSRLDLFSNFTYFLNDPVNGDQFGQPDRRVTAALNVTHSRKVNWSGPPSEWSAGLQLQNDNIFNALTATRARQTLATVREDHVVQSSAGVFAEVITRWSPGLRTVFGLRADAERARVASDLKENSGRSRDAIVNPKASLIAVPAKGIELFLNAGGGFHSNDARGTTTTIDPSTGSEASRVTPLARSRGGEIGLRTRLIPGLQSSLVAYRLDYDSELLFVGDAGTTEPSRPSRRTGVEWATYYQWNKWFTADMDVAFARARFRGTAPEGNRIPGAVEGVAAFALTVNAPAGWSGSLQWRYFGPRPLVEDNSVRSSSTAQFNGRLGWSVTRDVRVELEGFNLTNRKASAIDYFYTSRLRGEPAHGREDIHFHPLESRNFRLGVRWMFR